MYLEARQRSTRVIRSTPGTPNRDLQLRASLPSRNASTAKHEGQLPPCDCRGKPCNSAHRAAHCEGFLRQLRHIREYLVGQLSLTRKDTPGHVVEANQDEEQRAKQVHHSILFNPQKLEPLKDGYCIHSQQKVCQEVVKSPAGPILCHQAPLSS